MTFGVPRDGMPVACHLVKAGFIKRSCSFLLFLQHEKMYKQRETNGPHCDKTVEITCSEDSDKQSD